MRSDLPTGTVTFLFTDVEGSTRLLHELGPDAYAAALAEHRMALRAAFAAHGGVEVDTQGDAFFVAFSTASAAATAACDTHDAMAAGVVRIRVGLHTGTPTVTDEGYVGADVHRAARVAGLAHGGQTLLTAATAALLDGTELVDLGAHRLKDFDGATRLYQLGHRDFPSLQTPGSVQLPTPATALLGREREVAQVAALLRLDDIGLVTITGPAGVGKTRLALAVAEAVATDFRDGVVVVTLASVAEPGLVLPTVARAAGLHPGDESDPLVSLALHFRDAAVLFVLDNLEQVVEAGPLLLDLLAACPGVKLAATSRTRLRLSGEREFPLSPLALPDCVTLFVERARAVRPDLDTGEASLCAIEELCGGLDGLPLAIELAAARAKVLSPQAMHARLGDRLGLLAGGARDLPVRQQALRSTLDWSHELLGERERRLFARLAVFAGGFTLEAAEAVCDADLDTLSALVDISLVHTDGERFGTLETVRAYAGEQLAAGREEDDVRQRHAATFLELVERVTPRLAGADQARWLGVLETEHDNLRGALHCSLGAGDVETSLRLTAALWRFWLERGYVSEGRRWLGLALAAGDGAHAAVRAKALTGAGMLAHYDGDYAGAEALCRESIELHAAAGDQSGTAAAVEGLALAMRTRGDYSTAETLFGEALTIFRELGDAEGVARTLDRLGIAVWFGGDDDRAFGLVEESLEAFRRLDDRAGIGLVLTDLGLVTLSRGDAEVAQQLLDDGLALSREVTDRWNVAKALYGLGDAARARRDLVHAATRYHEGLTIAVEYGFRWFVALFLERLAGLSTTAGLFEQSARLFGAADVLRQAIGAPMPPYFRALYDDDLAALRTRLDLGTLDAVWADGREQTVETLLAAALATLPATPSAGPDGLTSRETAVLKLVALGLTDAQVAERLVVSPRTVHAHLRSIYRKLDVPTRSAATRYAVEHGLLQDR